MESPSEQETPSPEPATQRPAALEMGNGLAIFSLVFLVFLLAQSVFLVERVINTTPELSARGFSMDILDDGLFQERAQDLIDDGDTVSSISLWSGLSALVLLLAFTYWWKKDRIVSFLGLRFPAFRPLAAWAGLFVLCLTAMELIAWLLPDLDNSFMENVLATAHNKPLLFLGSALMPALFEEFFLRGLLFGSLRHVLDKHMAIAIVSGLFTIMHLQYPWYFLLLFILPLGVLLGYARANTGSLWTSVLLHFLNNAISLALPQLP